MASVLEGKSLKAPTSSDWKVLSDKKKIKKDKLIMLLSYPNIITE